MLSEDVNHLLNLQGGQGALLLAASVKQESLGHAKVEAENRQTSLRVAVAAKLITHVEFFHTGFASAQRTRFSLTYMCWLAHFFSFLFGGKIKFFKANLYMRGC